MTQPLRVLIVEDNASDAELMLRELRRAGFTPEAKRVDTEADYVANLHSDLELILSDYSMPQFSGLRALELLKERGLEIPFILVSATIGEEMAVTAMREGAADYLLKDRLARLGHAVEHALEQNRLRAERKRVGERLLEQADMINRAQDAIIVGNFEDERITFWNNGAERLYGWRADEAIGQLIGKLIYADPKERETAINLLASTEEFRGELKHVTKDGREVIVDGRLTIGRNPDGAPRSVLSINTDITEQKKIEGQFLRAQRLESIGILASGVAHDLNNILLPIMMAAPVLRAETDPTERERFLTIVESSARRGADVIKQMLTFARGANGDRVLLQPIYLLEEVSKIAGRTFPKSIALRTVYEENIRSLEADPTQLHQVLLNLCINARDAMPGGGALCLGAANFDVDAQYARITPGATVGPHIVLEVTDTGSGIPKEVIAKIFDPFFTTKSIGHGTGLGLSTVVGIVKSYGGFISVSSEPGHTCFKIFLPARATLDTEAALHVETMVPRGAGQTILLVDDEPSISEVAEVILKSHGYEVLVAEDATAALALFAQKLGHIAVVVTDLAMPGMDGLTLVPILRRIDPGLTVIVSTGRTDDSDAAEIAALNVDGCLTKPYTTHSLLLKLSHVLQNRSKRGQSLILTTRKRKKRGQKERKGRNRGQSLILTTKRAFG